jgi:DNA-binding NarL/FixJ family response regulator
MAGGEVFLGCGDDVGSGRLAEVLTARGHQVLTDSGAAEKLVDLAVASDADILVLGGVLSGPALRAIAVSARNGDGMPVLVVGPPRPNIDVFVALASRVSGYLPAGSAAETIADAVEVVRAGEFVMPRSVSLPLVDRLHTGGRGFTVERSDGRLVELTHREWEVLVLVRQAHTTAEIASQLVVSRVTVRTHIAALVAKLGLSGRDALASPRWT